MEYIIDSSVIERNYAELSQYGSVYYPLKTNDTQLIVDHIAKLSDGRLLISNLNQAKRVKINSKHTTVINTLLSIDELLSLYSLGIRCFVFDNYAKMVEFLSQVDNKSIEITVKISLGQIQDMIVNTGADNDEQIKMISYLIEHNYKYGYSIYINSIAKRIVDKQDISNLIRNNCQDIRCKFISLGGIDAVVGEDSKSYTAYLSGIRGIVKSYNKEFRIEPGEQLVGNAVDGIAEILAIHSNKNSISLTIKGSTYREFYDTIAFNKVYDFCMIKSNNGGESIQVYKQKLPNTIKIHIFGNSSDSNDYIGKYFIESGKQVAVGDEIKLLNVGAYFNRENLF